MTAICQPGSSVCFKTNATKPSSREIKSSCVCLAKPRSLIFRYRLEPRARMDSATTHRCFRLTQRTKLMLKATSSRYPRTMVCKRATFCCTRPIRPDPSRGRCMRLIHLEFRLAVSAPPRFPMHLSTDWIPITVITPWSIRCIPIS